MIDGSVLPRCFPPATPPLYTACNGDIYCLGIAYDRAAVIPGELGELIYKGFGALGLRDYNTGAPKPGCGNGIARLV